MWKWKIQTKNSISYDKKSGKFKNSRQDSATDDSTQYTGTNK